MTRQKRLTHEVTIPGEDVARFLKKEAGAPDDATIHIGENFVVKWTTTETLPDQPASEEDWIPWNGGENPVPGKSVEVTLRSGNRLQDQSDFFRWHYKGNTDDITLYRIQERT